jgi:hypothetical protein
MKRRGERGHPCLTPLRMSIQTVKPPPKKGATLTEEREPLTKFVNQEGKPTFFRTWRIQLWSMESKAFAVSRRNKILLTLLVTAL